MQLPLPVTLPANETFESFVPGTNDELYNVLVQLSNHMPEWRTQQDSTLKKQPLPLVNIVGGTGQGKSHLLYAICHQAAAKDIPHIYLNLEESDNWSPMVFDGLEQLPLICIDNLHALASKATWEEALFDLFNRIGENQISAIVMTSQFGPQHPGFKLPDLRSRLGWGVTYHLHSLDDEQRMQALRYRAQQHGLAFSDTGLQFLLNHCERDMINLTALLDRLDKRSLQEQKRVTVAMVKRELGLDE